MQIAKSLLVVIVAFAASVVIFFAAGPDMLKGLSSNVSLNRWQMQLAMTGFCLSSLPDALLQAANEDSTSSRESNASFKTDGNVEDDDYDKASIYSLMYAMYRFTGEVISEKGVPYQFTFNTWGFAPSPFAVEDPQRFGKAAYAGLFDSKDVQEYLKKLESPKIVEIGSGTGAGANLITREVVKTAQYLAIDMQKSAIDTCERLHATPDNQGLKCVHAPAGVGNDGGQVRDEFGNTVPDHSVDFVIVSETHIADVQIGPEEKAIFLEIHRILKPGGFFLWGNALPTRVWHEGFLHLSSNGFQRVSSTNHTAGAVLARDEDAPRVNAYTDSLALLFPIFSLPRYGPKCKEVAQTLIKNFYRHPGTALYYRMVTGFDSYMHEAYQSIMIEEGAKA